MILRQTTPPAPKPTEPPVYVPAVLAERQAKARDRYTQAAQEAADARAVWERLDAKRERAFAAWVATLKETNESTASEADA